MGDECNDECGNILTGRLDGWRFIVKDECNDD